ncbi:MAG: hypothetical protein JAZ17_27655 [Candidatus Thiodiazotropha endolucinida]|nr:hypothetical protein [Candidatus Thiodiazotropha endolucinida]
MYEPKAARRPLGRVGIPRGNGRSMSIRFTEGSLERIESYREDYRTKTGDTLTDSAVVNSLVLGRPIASQHSRNRK